MNVINAKEFDFDIGCKKGSCEKYSGIVEAYYENGGRYYLYSYKEGRQFGDTIKWHKNGVFSHLIKVSDSGPEKILFRCDVSEEDFKIFCNSSELKLTKTELVELLSRC